MSAPSEDILHLVGQALHDRGLVRRGAEFYYRCTDHDDTNPSAHWNSQKATWFCSVCNHGGGAIDLAKRLGLTLPEIDYNNLHIVDQYYYTDGLGNLLYQVLRLNPRGFRQRRPDGNGGWVWGLGDVRRVIYRLSGVLEADKSETIYIVEGEKDVESLRRLGLVATTSGAAGSWRPDFNQYFKGRRVVIIPDLDEPGEGHALDVASNLEAVAREVLVLRLTGLPPKGDITDWIDQHGGSDDEVRRDLEEAVKSIRSQQERTYRALEEIGLPDVQASGRPTGFRDLDTALLGGLRDGQLVIIAARPGVGKSALAAGLAHHASAGGGRVGIFSLEMSEQEVARRIRSYGSYERASIYIDEAMGLTIEELIRRSRLMHEDEGVNLLIVDYLQLMGGGSENRVHEMGSISRGLKMLARELNIPIVALSQLNREIEHRADRTPRLSDLRESGNLEQDSDIVAFLEREECHDAETSLRGVASLNIQKNRHGPRCSIPIAFHAPTTRFIDLQPATD